MCYTVKDIAVPLQLGREMSTTVRFHVLSINRPAMRLWGELPVMVVMSHYGDSTEVVEQCFGDNRKVSSKPLPEGCYLYRDELDVPEGTREQRTGTYGTPLRYTTANKLVKQLKMPSWCGHFDHAMMAYLKCLAKEAPSTVVVLELF